MSRLDSKPSHARPWARAGFGLAVAAALCVLAAGGASAGKHHDKKHGHPSYAPPPGKKYHGVSDTGDVKDFNKFKRQVRAHPAALQLFYHWDVSLKASGAFKRWRKTNTRGVVSLTTALPATGEPEITPHAIARGEADHYLLRLNESIANRANGPVYFRLFAEMNGHWNPYSAFNGDGSYRGRSHSPSNFIRAWRRFVIIVRGGPRKKVNHRLRHNDMARIFRARSNNAAVYRREDVPKRLPKPEVAFLWVPQSVGSPDIQGNQPDNYWPGGQFVDWVGIDIYAKYESFAFPHMKEFFHQHRGRPFVIGEYSPWDDDEDGSFVRHLFAWAKHEKRVRMLLYYRSTSPGNAHNLQFYPGARQSLRRILDHQGRYPPYAPGEKPKKHHR